MFRIFLPSAGLDSTDKKLLLLLDAAFFIGHYDMTVLSLAMPDVQESFNIAEQDLGKVIGVFPGPAYFSELPAV